MAVPVYQPLVTNIFRLGAYPFFHDKAKGWMRIGVQGSVTHHIYTQPAPPKASALVSYDGTSEALFAGAGASFEVGTKRLGVRLDSDLHRTVWDVDPSIYVNSDLLYGSVPSPYSAVYALSVGVTASYYVVHKHASRSEAQDARFQVALAAREEKQRARADEKEAERLAAEREAQRQAEAAAALAAQQAEAQELARIAAEARAAEAAAANPKSTDDTSTTSGSTGLLISSGRVAVLELTGPLPPQETQVLTDQVRGTIVKALPSAVAVMTKENMEVMLTDMGIDASCIAEGACEVETARNLGVDYVVSGSITEFGDTLVLSLKLHDVAGGMLMAQETAKAPSALDLLNEPILEATKNLVTD